MRTIAVHSLFTPARLRLYPRALMVAVVAVWALQTLAYGYDGRDYVAFFAAASYVLEDPEANPYLTKAFLQFQQDHTPIHETDVSFWFNPPSALLLYAPFARLPYWWSFAAWSALSAACWMVGARLIQLYVQPRDPRAFFKWALLYPPCVMSFFYGQATGLAFVVLVSTYVLLQRGHEARAGAVLSLLAFKPQLALGMALPLLLRGRWRALLAGLVGVMLQVGLSGALWPEQYAHFADNAPRFRDALFDPHLIGFGVHTLAGFWWLLLGRAVPSVAAALTLTTSLALLAGLALGWRRVPWDPTTETWKRAMAATVLGGFLVGLHLWTYDLALLVLPAAIVASLQTQALDRATRANVTALVWAATGATLLLTQNITFATRGVFGFGFALQLTTPLLVYAAWLTWPLTSREVSQSAPPGRARPGSRQGVSEGTKQLLPTTLQR